MFSDWSDEIASVNSWYSGTSFLFLVGLVQTFIDSSFALSTCEGPICRLIMEVHFLSSLSETYGAVRLFEMCIVLPWCNLYFPWFVIGKLAVFIKNTVCGSIFIFCWIPFLACLVYTWDVSILCVTAWVAWTLCVFSLYCEGAHRLSNISLLSSTWYKNNGLLWCILSVNAKLLLVW